jgi:hypothetical protein
MKPTSKAFLEEISKNCSNQITFYTFNKTTLQISDKYRDGRLSALKYIGELIFYYLQEEKSIKHRFIEQILKQMQQNSCLNDSDYKDGLYDALNDILNELKVATS